ncbi:MAG: 5,10-methylene tetrahydromethanopterin reductase [Acidobacteria bacterium]|nr:5,10-methylene tetrahydromethanopterin reductase [Acidobacteriota bacterium]|tara:strand:+ start:405 stop:1412 length:1008 start_codon:yes stop_codon:yes gene_type:complete
MLPLSVLDLAPVGPDSSPREAIADSVTLAQHCDALGYERYWVAEHHSMPSIATSAPEVLVAHVAAVTRRIRVGTGGIMLPNHNPLRLVEIFRTLEALYPGRIDFGVGRAPGTDPVTASALQRGTSDPNERLAELLAFDQSAFPDQHPFRNIVPMPSDVRLPPIWMLGSTMAGATIAASLGLRYAFAGHFAMRNARSALALYREQFRPSNGLVAPRAMLAVTVICGEDDAHANDLTIPLRLAVVRNRTGTRAPLPSIEEAKAYRFTADEERIADEFLHGAIVGGTSRVRAGLEQLVSETGADELMLAAFVPDITERLQSYERVSQAVELENAPDDT